jgi:pimeloyl-ACP methyl ester carboxylesterase
MAKSNPAYRAATEEVRSCRDPRVRAVFAMAPGLADAFLPDSLALIDIPVAIVAGAADEVVSVKRNAEFFAAKIPRAQLTIFRRRPVTWCLPDAASKPAALGAQETKNARPRRNPSGRYSTLLQDF